MAAEHICAVRRRIFFDKLLCYEALFALPCRVVRKNVHDLDSFAFGADLVKLSFEHDIIRLHRAIEYRERTAAHFAVGYLLCHGVKRRDAAAACEGDYVFRIAQRLPIKSAEWQRTVEHVAGLYVFKQVVGHEIRHVAAHGYLEKRLLAARLIRSRGNGIRSCEQALAYSQAEVYELAALEHGDVPVNGLKAEGFCAG